MARLRGDRGLIFRRQSTDRHCDSWGGCLLRLGHGGGDERFHLRMNFEPTLLRELLVACLQRDFDDRLTGEIVGFQ